MQRNSSIVSVSSFAPELAGEEHRDPPETTVERWCLWHAKPDAIRSEFVVGRETVTAIFAGTQWWSWSPTMGHLTNTAGLNASHGLGPAEVLVETPSLLGFLKLQTVGRTTFLSRSAYLVGAIPAKLDEHAPQFVLHALGAGADRYELVVDAEFGLVWRCQAELAGQAFRIIEVDELGINERLDDRFFEPDSLNEQ